MLRQRQGAQGVEGGRVLHAGTGVTAQRVRGRQVVRILFHRPPPVGRGVLLLDVLVLQRRRIAAVYHVAHHLEGHVEVGVQRQELVRLPHLPHADVVAEAEDFRPPREAYLADAPHVVAHHHVAAHQLEALALGDEADDVLQVVGLPLDGVDAVVVVLLRVGRQRREELVVEQRGRVDINAEVLGQLAVEVPHLAGGAHRGRHLLVVDVGSGEAQLVVGLHQILLLPLAHAEQGGDVAHQPVLLADVDVPLDVELRIVAVHNAFVERGEEDHLLHDGVGRHETVAMTVGSILRPCLPSAEKQQQNAHYGSQRSCQLYNFS